MVFAEGPLCVAVSVGEFEERSGMERRRSVIFERIEVKWMAR